MSDDERDVRGLRGALTVRPIAVHGEYSAQCLSSEVAAEAQEQLRELLPMIRAGCQIEVTVMVRS